MGLILWVILGIIAGAIARWIIPGTGPGGIIGDLIIGIVGAFLGGWVYGFFGHAGVTGFNLPSLVCAVIGAVVLLWVIRMVSGSRSSA
jgi:uncharacterized membrane protein YeaQ/YmgE (transglycosylase-associated protein family)